MIDTRLDYPISDDTTTGPCTTIDHAHQSAIAPDPEIVGTLRPAVFLPFCVVALIFQSVIKCHRTKYF
jgi:hypothetical protein